MFCDDRVRSNGSTKLYKTPRWRPTKFDVETLRLFKSKIEIRT